MRVLKWSVVALALLVGAFGASSADAQLFIEEFNNDQDPGGDNFEPETRDPFSEPDLGGLPPFSWRDIRANSGAGLMEENLSTVGDDPTYAPADIPGAATPEYGVVQFEGGDGPMWRNEFENYFTSTQNATVQYNIDNYADPAIPSRGFWPNGGVPDWWWTNAVNSTVTNDYLTETGITGNANPDGTWTYATTNNIHIATVPAGEWYELEVEYITTGADLAALHTVYDSTGTVVLGTPVLLTSLFLNPPSSELGEPRYSWITFGTANVDVLFFDDMNILAVPVPEPSAMALLGMGAIGLVAVRRRKRRLA